MKSKGGWLPDGPQRITHHKNSAFREWLLTPTLRKEEPAIPPMSEPYALYGCGDDHYRSRSAQREARFNKKALAQNRKQERAFRKQQKYE